MVLAARTARELADEILDLQRAVRCIALASPRREGMGVAPQFVLGLIGEGESRASRLAQRLGVGAAVLSRHITDLEERGYLVRKRDSHDGRVQLLAITTTGVDRLREIDEQRAAVFQEHLCDWSEQEASNTAKTVQKLTEALKKAARS
jgi:DNA-binding MarR family transcriptional regulator